MEVHLPYSIGSRDVSALMQMAKKVYECQDEKIVFNGERVHFIDPFGLTTLGALLCNLRDRKLSMPWLPRDVASYMARMDLFKHFDIDGVEYDPNASRADASSRLVELRCLQNSTESEKLANDLADAITGTIAARGEGELGEDRFEKFRHPIWYSLSELLDNSITHARQKNNTRASVWIASQYYPSGGYVRMSVTDNGCGMLATLEKHEQLKEKTHLEAVKAALVPRVSCNRDGSLYLEQGNQGVGLTTTARIARAARGHITVVSGDAVVRNRMQDAEAVVPRGFWKGVSIGFQCKRAQLPAVRLGQLLPAEQQGDAVKLLNFG
jgi:hypothetical protein